MKTRSIALISFCILVLGLLLFSGCIKQKKECESGSQCPSKLCSSVSCSDEGKCVYALKMDCCGNLRCEEPKESKCTCPGDCKPCAGKKGRFMQYVCNADKECVVDIKKITTTVLDEHQFTYFLLAITSSFDQPFELQKSLFNVRIEFKDDHEDLVPPVHIKNIKVMERDVVLAEQPINFIFNTVGESNSVSFPLTFSFAGNDTTKSIQLKIDYEYVKRTREYNQQTKSYEYINSPVQRESYTKSFTQKIDFVNSNAN